MCVCVCLHKVGRMLLGRLRRPICGSVWMRGIACSFWGGRCQWWEMWIHRVHQESWLAMEKHQASLLLREIPSSENFSW